MLIAYIFWHIICLLDRNINFVFQAQRNTRAEHILHSGGMCTGLGFEYTIKSFIIKKKKN
jgi:hypothetical protein